MFTGLIEDLGFIYKKGSNFIVVNSILKDVKIGDSLAINGVCLTVVKIENSQKNSNNFTLDIMPETLKRTNLGKLHNNEKINIERALTLNSRLDGHIVQGHVETTAKIKNISIKNNSKIIELIPNEKKIIENIIEKGSISIDGISLTIVNVNKNSFSVSIIPETWKKTNIQYKKINSLCNIETDIITKTINSKTKNIDIKTLLKEEGFL